MKYLLLFLALVVAYAGDIAAEQAEVSQIVTGKLQITEKWAIDLGETQFNRRFKGSSVIFWRSGITVNATSYNYPPNESRNDVAAKLKKQMNAQLPADKTLIELGSKSDRFGYFLKESEGERTYWSLLTYTFGSEGTLLATISFDRERDLEWAKKIWTGIDYTGPITKDGSGQSAAK